MVGILPPPNAGKIEKNGQGISKELVPKGPLVVNRPAEMGGEMTKACHLIPLEEVMKVT